MRFEVTEMDEAAFGYMVQYKLSHNVTVRECVYS